MLNTPAKIMMQIRMKEEQQGAPTFEELEALTTTNDSDSTSPPTEQDRTISPHLKAMIMVSLGILLASFCILTEKGSYLKKKDPDPASTRPGDLLLKNTTSIMNDTKEHTIEATVQIMRRNKTTTVTAASTDPATQRDFDDSPRILLMGGCSGSTTTQHLTRELLLAHGVPAYSNVPFELLNANQNKKLDQARKQLLNRGVTEPTDEQVRIQSIRIYQKLAADQGKVLIFKSNPEKWFDILMQIINSSDQTIGSKSTVRLAQMQRRNVLDMDICLIRDCAGKGRVSQTLGYPVYAANGTKSRICFERRKQKKNDKSNNDKTVVVFNTTELAQDLRVKHVEQVRMVKKLQNVARNNGRPMFPQYYEDLFAFEYTNEEAVFQSSLQAWTLFLQSLVDQVNQTILVDMLAPFRNSRPPPVSHNELIYNYDQVVAELENGATTLMIGIYPGGVVNPDEEVDLTTFLRRPNSNDG